MGFNSVYRSLQEVFPQVDARLLKAVAIEHSKDADTAVEVVLSEVLPYISKRPISRGENQDIGVTSDGGVESEEQIIMLKRQQVAEEATAGSSSKPDSIARENANDTDNAINAHPINSICPEEAAPNGSSVLNSSDLNDGHEQVCVSIESEVSMPQEKGQEVNAEVGPDNTAAGMPLEKGQEVNAEVEPDKTAAGTSITLMQEDGANDDRGLLFGNFSSEELISFGKCQETCVNVVCDQISNVTPTTLFHEGRGVADSSNDLRADWEDFDWPVAIDLNTVALGKSHQEVSSLDSTSLTVGDSVAQLVPSSVQEHAPDAQDCVLQLEINSGTSITDCEKPETSGSSDPTFKQGNSVGELVDFEDESTLNALVTRSGQICRIDLLEDIIEDAKDNKKTLFSAMESVINMMREVEVKEKAVEQAKGEAARGGLDILIKVEELKRMLGHAKEANDMHAGEVYGEKSILATEARELQSRLLCLSDERDKSLAILDEMHQTLEVRLAAAEDERKAAEQEKLEKEEVARRALAEQESIMETVVQESRILHEEAEENSKLREFLMDRGRIVDMLQGEISVICQDVRLLKQKFDERVPLSKSVSSSQTSCILASSSSSLKSMASIEQGETPENPKKTSPAPSINGQSPKGSPTSSIDGRSPKSSPEEKRTSYDKALLDDGWDLFDNDAELYR